MLNCINNSLNTLNISNNINLTGLLCNNNNLSSLNVSNNKKLKKLECYNNNLNSLNLSGLTDLEWVICTGNNLSELTLKNNFNLQHLECYSSTNTRNHNISELDISDCTELTELRCDYNNLKNLDLSKNINLTHLECAGNRLEKLDLSNNTKLKELWCSGNALTELDLSNIPNLYADCNGQLVHGLNVTYVNGRYQVNLGDYVSNLARIEKSSLEGYEADSNVAVRPISYDPLSGIVLFSFYPAKIRYEYHTRYVPNQNTEQKHNIPLDLMTVTIDREDGEEPDPTLKVEAIERGIQTGTELICGIESDCYTNKKGIAIDELYVANCDYATYGKLGFVADGNSRLILRVQSDKPGRVAFNMNGDDKNIGIGLESLTRRSIPDFETSLETSEVADGVFQASAVLIAPEAFPLSRKNFPSDTFSVTIDFTGEDGTTATNTIDLKIEAAPVLLIPGMFNPGGFTNVFAVASVLASAVNLGDSQHTFGLIQQELLSRGFKKEHITFWNHSGRKGIKNLIGHDYNSLFTILANMFESYAQEGIVCTKADVIAHGMGGLIVREFLNEANKSDANDANNWSARSYKQGMIHKVINIAVPHMGTPLANVLLGDFSVLNNVAVGNDTLAQNCLWLLHNKYLKIYSEPFLKEIAVGSDFLNNLPLPANVPMHFVYGDVKGYLDSFENIKDTAFMLFNLAKLVKSAGKNIAKYQKLSEYSDFVQFSNTLQNFNPKTDLELLKTINNLDNKILLRVANQQEAIIRDMMTNDEIRSFALSFAEMASQDPQVTGFFQILSMVSDILGEDLNPVELAFNLYFSMQRVIFSGQAHDMFVPVDSAVTMLREYSTGFPEPGFENWMDWRFRHSTLCQQGDVAYAVATILRRNDMNDFAILKKTVQLTGASPQQVKASSTDYGELNLEGIDLENLCVTNFALTANQSAIMIPKTGTSVVKFTASAKNLVNNDVQLVIQKDGLDRIFPMYTDDGKSFEINIEFTSSDLGAMFAYCYTPNDKKLYVSNTLQFSCIRNLGNLDITEISFFGKDTLYTNVNSEIPAGLYAVDSDGGYYDISSPLAGTQWTSTEIARVNDNGCIHGLKEGNTTLTASFRGLSTSINVNVGAALTYDDSSEKTESKPQPTPDNNPSNNEDSPNSGGNTDAAPDLDNPSANDAKPEQVSEMRVEGHKAGAYSKNVPTTSLTTAEVRELLGNKWSDIPFRSMESDMDQTDNRTNEDKEALLKELIEYTKALSGDVLYAFVLRPMKPRQSGIFTFALPLPTDMKNGDTLVWCCKRSLSNVNTNTASVYSSDYEEEVIFIDTAIKEETKVVPESRAVSVSAYLETGYIYEPVVMTVANNSNKQVSGGGGGCNSGFVMLGAFALAGALFLKKC